MISKLPYLGLGAYLVTSIFYVLPSGLPQPADFLLVATILLAIVLWSRIPHAPILYVAVTVFCLWIWTVNMFWFAVYGDSDFPIKSAFYVFNALVLVFVITAGWRDWTTLCFVIRWACVIALFVQAVYIAFVPATTSGGIRFVGTFNNPNQLGYWALLAMAMLAIAKDHRPFTLIDLAALGAGSYAVLLSLSKAAMASAVLLLVLIFIFQRVRPMLVMAVASSLFLAFSVNLLASGNAVETISNWSALVALERRVSHVQTDDNIMNRGYRVILDNPEYWALGAGEAHYRARFKPEPKNSEVHSSLGNLFLSYGLVGLGLFCIILWLVFARAEWASRLYFVPIMAYSMVHMGLRFSEFWIFLALVYAQCHYRQGCQGKAVSAGPGAAWLGSAGPGGAGQGKPRMAGGPLTLGERT